MTSFLVHIKTVGVHDLQPMSTTCATLQHELLHDSNTPGNTKRFHLCDQDDIRCWKFNPTTLGNVVTSWSKSFP